MTTELSTQLKTHVIVTMKGMAYFVGEELAVSLLNDDYESSAIIKPVPDDPSVGFAFHQVAQVCTAQEYYDEHPDKRPHEPNLFVAPEQVGSSSMSVAAYDSLIKGMKSTYRESGNASAQAFRVRQVGKWERARQNLIDHPEIQVAQTVALDPNSIEAQFGIKPAAEDDGFGGF